MTMFILNVIAPWFAVGCTVFFGLIVIGIWRGWL